MFPLFKVPKRKKRQKKILFVFHRLLGKWPNTYTFTKAVAENVIKKQAGDMPIGIFRPAIG